MIIDTTQTTIERKILNLELEELKDAVISVLWKNHNEWFWHQFSDMEVELYIDLDFSARKKLASYLFDELVNKYGFGNVISKALAAGENNDG
jgi:hypothetical protein